MNWMIATIILASLFLCTLLWLVYEKGISRTYANTIGEREDDIEQLTEQIETLEIKCTHLQQSLSEYQIKASQSEGALKTSDLHYKNQIEQLQDERENDIKQLTEQIETLEIKCTHLQQSLSEYQIKASQSEGALKTSDLHYKNQIKQLQDAREELTQQFKMIAAEIIDEKSKNLRENNFINMENIITPLKDKLKEFQELIIHNNQQQSADKALLDKQLQELRNLNQNLSEEANNLTLAIRGNNKTQGNWGEMILEKILENSGLIKGEEYATQVSFNGKIPDAILYLPNNRCLIIDAKVSLTSYNDYINTQEIGYLKNHVASIRKHIQELSEKSYQNIDTLQTVDFVLMFLPVEPAYLDAIKQEPLLWSEAYQKHIILVSPSTLYPVLRMVENLWQIEKQNKNTQEIVKTAGGLYDKFAALLTDLEKMDKQLNTVQQTYHDCVRKIKGKGGLFSKTDSLRKMGAQTTKDLPQSFAEEDLLIENQQNIEQN